MQRAARLGKHAGHVERLARRDGIGLRWRHARIVDLFAQDMVDVDGRKERTRLGQVVHVELERKHGARPQIRDLQRERRAILVVVARQVPYLVVHTEHEARLDPVRRTQIPHRGDQQVQVVDAARLHDPIDAARHVVLLLAARPRQVLARQGRCDAAVERGRPWMLAQRDLLELVEHKALAAAVPEPPPKVRVAARRLSLRRRIQLLRSPRGLVDLHAGIRLEQQVHRMPYACAIDAAVVEHLRLVALRAENRRRLAVQIGALRLGALERHPPNRRRAVDAKLGVPHHAADPQLLTVDVCAHDTPATRRLDHRLELAADAVALRIRRGQPRLFNRAPRHGAHRNHLRQNQAAPLVVRRKAHARLRLAVPHDHLPLDPIARTDPVAALRVHLQRAPRRIATRPARMQTLQAPALEQGQEALAERVADIAAVAIGMRQLVKHAALQRGVRRVREDERRLALDALRTLVDPAVLATAVDRHAVPCDFQEQRRYLGADRHAKLFRAHIIQVPVPLWPPRRPLVRVRVRHARPVQLRQRRMRPRRFAHT